MTSNQKLKKIREDLQLDQAQFSELVGIPRGTVSRWEAGEPIPIKKLKYLSEKLGISTFNIFDDDIVDGLKIDTDEKVIERIKNLYAQLPADKKLEVLKMIIDGK